MKRLIVLLDVIHARPQDTQSASQGALKANAIADYYAGPQWTVFKQNRISLPENAAFHVITDPNSANCNVFGDRLNAHRRPFELSSIIEEETA